MNKEFKKTWLAEQELEEKGLQGMTSSEFLAKRDAIAEAMIASNRKQHRTLVDWGSIETFEDWNKMKEKAREDLYTGASLMYAFGFRNNVSPHLIACIMALREEMVKDLEITSAAELILIDQAIIAYGKYLDMNNTIDDALTMFEHDLFKTQSPGHKLKKAYKRNENTKIDSLDIDEKAGIIVQKLIPTLDPLNKIYMRCVKGISEMRGKSIKVNIAKIEQLNMAQSQVNKK